MAMCVTCLFKDGSRQTVDDQYVDFADAAGAALRLADAHSGDKGDGHGPPARFEVWIDRVIALSVAVLPHRLPAKTN